MANEKEDKKSKKTASVILSFSAGLIAAVVADFTAMKAGLEHRFQRGSRSFWEEFKAGDWKNMAASFIAVGVGTLTAVLAFKWLDRDSEQGAGKQHEAVSDHVKASGGESRLPEKMKPEHITMEYEGTVATHERGVTK